jgi:hypothetical protein
MNARLEHVLAKNEDEDEDEGEGLAHTNDGARAQADDGDAGLPDGWRRVPSGGAWRPCPIGVYVAA